MTTPDPTRLQAIREREQAASQGPWHDDGYRLYQFTESADKRDGRLIFEYKHLDLPHYPDYCFIKHARSDIPYLLSQLDQATAERDRYKAALEKIASGETYCESHKVEAYCGEVAKEALSPKLP